MAINILVFEDAQVEKLRPLTVGRAAFSITCACRRLSDWFSEVDAHVVLKVRNYLETVCQESFSGCSLEVKPNFAWTLLVNARIVPSSFSFKGLDALVQRFESATLVGSGQQVAVDQNGDCMVAAIPTSLVNLDAMEDLASRQPASDNTDCLALESFCFPHDVVRFNQQYFTESISEHLDHGNYFEIKDGVFAAEGAKVDANFAAETSAGPVVIERGAVVGPYTYFEGPVFVGPHSKVLEHASIKDCVCLTHTVKVGGEVEASVIEPYSNKQHHGFLGHSYLGSWINIGAGTCNSDLKNTYGNVNVQYGNSKVSTDLQFIGCFIGDYAKTAINTSIFTGKSIGACSMSYGFVTNNVPSFTNFATIFDQITSVPVAVMLKTQQRMFARRGLAPKPSQIALIHDMYESTNDERSALELSEAAPNFKF